MLTNSAKEAVLRAAAVLPALLKAAGGLRSQVRLAQHRLLLAAAVQHMDHAAAESLAAVFSDERHAHPVRQESIEQQPLARGVQPSAAQVSLRACSGLGCLKLGRCDITIVGRVHVFAHAGICHGC